MAVFSKSGLLQKLAELVRSAGTNGKTSAKNVRDMFTHVIDTLFHELGSINDFGPELAWDAGLTYHTTDYPFAISGLRVFRTKVNDNRNHPPPTEPDANGIYQDAYWVEVSPAPTSGIAEWKAGVYGNGLVIVYRDGKLWRLSDTVDRPFDSTDFIAEAVDEKWVAISSDSAATGTNHTQNTDTKLAEGTADEVSAAELRANLDNSPASSNPDALRYSFFHDLDTVGGEVTIKGPQQVSDFYYSSNLVSVSFQVKSDAATAFTPQADVAALNSWIGNTNNVADSEALWQVYPVANYGGNTGAASATIVF